MRRINAILTVIILILFLVHSVLGGLLLIGAGQDALKMVARSLEGLIYIHALIGLILTGKSLWIGFKTGQPYFRQNKLFWTRRISGVLVMVLMLFHTRAFADRTAAVYRLKFFGSAQLVTQILFVLSLALHIIANVRPMLISFGLKKLRRYEGDILFVLSLVLTVFAAAFIIYFLRWRSI